MDVNRTARVTRIRLTYSGKALNSVTRFTKCHAHTELADGKNEGPSDGWKKNDWVEKNDWGERMTGAKRKMMTLLMRGWKKPNEIPDA